MSEEKKSEFFKPRVLGRFNYITFKPGLFNILFYPYFGNTATIIARNLTREDMEQIVGELNESLDNLRNFLNEDEQASSEEEITEESLSPKNQN